MIFHETTYLEQKYLTNGMWEIYLHLKFQDPCGEVRHIYNMYRMCLYSWFNTRNTFFITNHHNNMTFISVFLIITDNFRCTTMHFSQVLFVTDWQMSTYRPPTEVTNTWYNQVYIIISFTIIYDKIYDEALVILWCYCISVMIVFKNYVASWQE